MIQEIIFNQKGSFSEFGALLVEFTPQPPSPKIIKVDVPFMHGTYDFSTVATNGEMIFEQRKILCTLDFFSDNKAILFDIYSKILEWLMCGKKDLIYSGEPTMKYLAQVEEAPNFEEFISTNGTLSFNFIADPFKQSIAEVGSEEWDTFNFEIDFMQDTEFDIDGSQSVQIYNPGRTISPLVNCSSNMSAATDSYIAYFKTGDNTDWNFRLKSGFNTIKINGTGHIRFIFRKVVL